VNSVPSIGNPGYLTNGSEIAITGRPHQRTWEDGDHKRERIEVVADPHGVVFLDAPAHDPADDDAPESTAPPRRTSTPMSSRSDR
jgi:single-stranded DNA-binding protein